MARHLRARPTRTALAVTAIVVSLGGCATERVVTPSAEYAVGGVVMAGPTCPVANRALDPACGDRPVAGAELLVLDGTGRVIAEVVSAASGTFSVLLPAGSYELVPQPVDGLLGTAAPLAFDAGPNGSPDLVVTYDTGIR